MAPGEMTKIWVKAQAIRCRKVCIRTFQRNFHPNTLTLMLEIITTAGSIVSGRLVEDSSIQIVDIVVVGHFKGRSTNNHSSKLQRQACAMSSRNKAPGKQTTKGRSMYVSLNR